jgi:1,4-alpha-glucan branching enzyme
MQTRHGSFFGGIKEHFGDNFGVIKERIDLFEERTIHRFSEVDKKLNEHTQSLNSHTLILHEHTQILGRLMPND